MASPSTVPALPVTQVQYNYITLSDTSPDLTKVPNLSFTFPAEMIADPLTSVGPAGYGPDNKSPWWPLFQARHKVGPLYWVQGHMLNDNVHGPGNTGNLVPISNTLNTNMSAMVEELVKKRVAAGKILRYVVRAHWEWGRGFSSPSRPASEHPRLMRESLGIRGLDPNGELLWGEQFAPTRLSWELYEYTNWPPTSAPAAVSLSRGDTWNNNIPT